jgi:hypothetical protein
MGKQTGGLQLKRGVVLKFVDDNEGPTSEGLFIGIAAGSDYVVVPLSNELASKKAGDGLHARCMVQGDMVEFRSVIVEIILSPVVLWRIEEPTAVRKYDLRDHKRIQCSVSASIEAVHKGQVFTGIIRDISKSGARCLFPLSEPGGRHFEMHEKIILRCAFPGIQGEQAAVATITEIAEQETDLSIAIQFEDPAWWVPPYH